MTAPRTHFDWTPEIEARAVALWRDNVPVPDICAEIGVNQGMLF